MYTARFRRSLVVDGWEFNYRTLPEAQDNVVLSKVNMTGLHNLVIPAQVEIAGRQCNIVGFDNNLFNGNKELYTITLPGTIEFLSGDAQSSANERDPFSGCGNLDEISIDGECARYYVGADGSLYNSEGVLVSVPMGTARKGLAELIGRMETLAAQVATYNPAGKANELELQVKDAGAANYLWANSVETSEGSIAHLVDGIKGNNSNFFHTDWHTVTTPEGYHYIEVDLGEEYVATSFRFSYHTRTNCSNDFPDAVTVMGSNDKVVYSDVYTVSSGLPQAAGRDYTSAVFSCGQPYRYLRFKVVAERVYWHMGEFELYYMSSTASVFKQFEGTALNDAYAAAMYDVLLSAVSVYQYGTTAAQVSAAKNELQKAYDELLEMVKANDSTGIADVKDEAVEQKLIYDLTGCCYADIIRPGFYIVDGEKVFIR